MTSVYWDEPCVKGVTPAARPSSLVWTSSRNPSRRAVSSRKEIISRNFHPVSM